MNTCSIHENKLVLKINFSLCPRMQLVAKHKLCASTSSAKVSP